MSKLSKLLESLGLEVYKMDVVVRVKRTQHLEDFYNSIRGIENVITVKAKDHREFDDWGVSLLTIKIISRGNLESSVRSVFDSITGIPGVLKFKPLKDTAEKI